MRLPKQLDEEPAAEGLPAEIERRGEPLWREGVARAPRARFAGQLRQVLIAAEQQRMLVRGLENAERTLAAEARGQALADARAEEPRRARVSRLVVLSDDGAERFYRQVEALLRKHEGRLLALRLDADAATLGGALFGEGAEARLVLLEHKSAVAEALLALLEQWR